MHTLRNICYEKYANAKYMVIRNNCQNKLLGYQSIENVIVYCSVYISIIIHTHYETYGSNICNISWINKYCKYKSEAISYLKWCVPDLSIENKKREVKAKK